MSNAMGIAPEEMRTLLLKALATGSPRTQVQDLRPVVADVAVQQQLIPNEKGLGQNPLPPGWGRVFHEVLWSFIVEGLIVPGWGDESGSTSWPFLSVTEYGMDCLTSGEVLPYDYGGYLAELAGAAPLDPVESRYVPQALTAFRLNLPDASAVMLGCASEHLVLRLAQALVTSNPSAETTLDGMIASAGRPTPARKILEHVNDRLRDISASKSTDPRKLPNNLEEMRDTQFSAVAHIIRVSRNDAGHPARLQQVTRQEAFILLSVFRHYRKWVLDVIAHL